MALLPLKWKWKQQQQQQTNKQINIRGGDKNPVKPGKPVLLSGQQHGKGGLSVGRQRGVVEVVVVVVVATVVVVVVLVVVVVVVGGRGAGAVGGASLLLLLLLLLLLRRRTGAAVERLDLRDDDVLQTLHDCDAKLKKQTNKETKLKVLQFST